MQKENQGATTLPKPRSPMHHTERIGEYSRAKLQNPWPILNVESEDDVFDSPSDDPGDTDVAPHLAKKQMTRIKPPIAGYLPYPSMWTYYYGRS